MVTNSSHDCESLSGQDPWVAHFFIDDAVKHLLLIISWEWRLSQTTHSVCYINENKTHSSTNQLYFRLQNLQQKEVMLKLKGKLEIETDVL